MTLILKRDAGGDVRALGFEAPPISSTAEEEHIAELEKEIAKLQQALVDAEAFRLADAEAAHEGGRREAAAEYRRDEEKARATLAAALTDATERFDRLCDEADKLGLIFAAAALERLVAEPANYRALVASSIHLQIEGLKRDTILAVAVSAIDFKDKFELDALTNILDLNTTITASAALASGECHVDVRLGAIDISIPSYWSDLLSRCRTLLEGARP